MDILWISGKRNSQDQDGLSLGSDMSTVAHILRTPSFSVLGPQMKKVWCLYWLEKDHILNSKKKMVREFIQEYISLSKRANQCNRTTACLVAHMVKNLPETWENWVWSLSWEDPLEESMATHSSILAWSIPWPEEPGRLGSVGSWRVEHDWETKHSMLQEKGFFISLI